MDLLARLATEFDVGREDLATEALLHILRSSRAGSNALVEFLNRTGADVEENLRFRTQARQEDDSRPDLVGEDDERDLVAILEAKFTAGLTGNQPVTYIEHLAPDKGAVCLFIAPPSRHRNLWSELRRRCKESDLAVKELETETDQFRALQLPDDRCLMLSSWSTLLNAISFGLTTAGESERVEDVNQLEALCHRFETETFPPLEAWELSGTIGRRKIEFEEIVDGVKEEIIQKGWATGRGQLSRVEARYRQRVLLEGYRAHVSVAYKRWRDLRETPFWLGVKGPEGSADDWSEVRPKLARLQQESPSRLLETRSSYLLVPLFPPQGKEKDAVIDSLVNQVGEVRDLLRE